MTRAGYARPSVESSFFDLGRLDRLAYGKSPIHRLDPRAKLITTLLFLVCVVSFDKYRVSALLPFALYPFLLAVIAGLPLGYLGKRLLTIAPLAVLVGIFNPLLDRHPHLFLGTLAISGGWVSFVSILLRFALTIGAALTLVATTSFHGVCMALEKLGTPRILANQLLFLYRYLFVLEDEALRLVRARALRSFGRRGLGLRVYASLLGHLLLRTIARAQRIHLAMVCRGFDGEVRVLRKLEVGRAEVLFVLAWSAAFALFRTVDLPRLLGGLVERVGS